jgi:hypothetical protein
MAVWRTAWDTTPSMQLSRSTPTYLVWTTAEMRTIMMASFTSQLLWGFGAQGVPSNSWFSS